ncbi:nucleoside-diphosphate kinase, partial [Candidatus Sumerlaeota bacterium]|nr:nucleoside-diphosphate kinase [Candidatus Sumerlaeota bacterium]
MERTFVMLKPDAVERGLVGTVISRLERKGLQLAGMKLIKMSRSQAERLYAEHKGKDFYDKLIDFTTSGKVVVIVVKGENVIAHIRNLMGSTDPAQ